MRPNLLDIYLHIRAKRKETFQTLRIIDLNELLRYQQEKLKSIKSFYFDTTPNEYLSFHSHKTKDVIYAEKIQDENDIQRDIYLKCTIDIYSLVNPNRNIIYAHAGGNEYFIMIISARQDEDQDQEYLQQQQVIISRMLFIEEKCLQFMLHQSREINKLFQEIIDSQDIYKCNMLKVVKSLQKCKYSTYDNIIELLTQQSVTDLLKHTGLQQLLMHYEFQVAEFTFANKLLLFTNKKQTDIDTIILNYKKTNPGEIIEQSDLYFSNIQRSAKIWQSRLFVLSNFTAEFTTSFTIQFKQQIRIQNTLNSIFLAFYLRFSDPNQYKSLIHQNQIIELFTKSKMSQKMFILRPSINNCIPNNHYVGI